MSDGGGAAVTGQETPEELAAARRRDREIDRNGFFVDAEQLAKGVDSSGVPLEMPPKLVAQTRRRELKWLKMMRDEKSWGKLMKKKGGAKIKSRCRKGIPASLRGRAWETLLGATSLKAQHPTKYVELIAEADTIAADHPLQEMLDIIDKDLDRTFPHNDRFTVKGGEGQKILREVLRAYACYNKELGYCQGMGMIAGTFLMQMPPENAFWCLVRMLEEHLDGFFDSGLREIQIHAASLHQLLREQSPDMFALFETCHMTPVLYATDWLMCCFVKTAPWESVLRIWDQMLFEGTKVLFRVCLAILLQSEAHILAECRDMGEQMMYLRNSLPEELLMPENLMEHMRQIKLKSASIEVIYTAATAEYERDHPPKPKEKAKPCQKPAPSPAPAKAAQPRCAPRTSTTLEKGVVPPISQMPAPATATAVDDGRQTSEDAAAAMPPSLETQDEKVTAAATVASLSPSPLQQSGPPAEFVDGGDAGLERSDTVWRKQAANATPLAEAAEVLSGPGGAKLIGVVEM